MSSDNYPHTRAVGTQDAKFEFVPINPGENGNFNVNPGENGNFNADLPQLNDGQAPLQRQDRTSQQSIFQQAPNWQQGQAVQPPDYSQAQPQQQAPVQNEQTQTQTPAQNEQAQTQAPAQNEQAQTQAPAQNKQAQTQAPAQNKQAQTQAPAQNKQAQTQAPKSISQDAQQVIDLTNAERRQNGLPDLKADTQLCGVAQKKSDDMQQKNYFSHTSPTYGSPFDMMRDFGVTYTSAGENIAQGQPTPQEVVQAWMNSEGHKRNILSNSFTHIGVGFEQNGKHWTQMFISK
ncbi:hypothetical protein F7731_21225 [Cytobacillus depressus]|uniref:SCP domain-containing protein n=1 Tax=Cytobacillus depressus TaxID=1602942 RepID=A0A6L3UZS7_9BACI|nr:CAP domain-containing protein [Cytobacillus depressus]KAB2330014.1 hypothetical protein F7731_21225 [Cytobacillus depressus]